MMTSESYREVTGVHGSRLQAGQSPAALRKSTAILEDNGEEMESISAGLFLLDVKTSELTNALKKLRKTERKSHDIQLSYTAGTLLITMGHTSQELGAVGSWPSPIWAPAVWATALVKSPADSAITTLKCENGALFARDFRIDYQIKSRPVIEEFDRRSHDVSVAYQILAPLHILKSDINALVEKAAQTNSGLWALDDKLIDPIAQEWILLVSAGVEPSQILDMVNRKSRKLWWNRKHSLLDLCTVNEEERRALTRAANPLKALLWSGDKSYLIESVAKAWKILAVYGVEPSDIRHMLNLKGRAE